MKLPVDPYLEKLAEKNHKTYQRVLQAMLQHKEIHGSLAQDSNTPADILQKIAEQYDSEKIPYQVMGNPNCPRKILNLALNRIPDPQQIMDPALDADDEFELSMSSILDNNYSFSLATNESLTREDLGKLITKPYLADTLASRTNFPADFFVYLWENYLIDRKDPLAGFNQPLLKALAQNPKTPVKVLKNLSKYEILDSPNEIQSLLMSNPSLPETERAHYALLGITPVENRILKNFGWPTPYPSDIAFELVDFPDDLLLELAKIGHLGGLLRTEYIPDSFDDLDSDWIFKLWHGNDWMHKTLWPELREIEPNADFEFVHEIDGLSGYEKTYFRYGPINPAVDDFVDDFYSIEGLPDWFTSTPDVGDSIANLSWREIDDIVEFGLEAMQAWALAIHDSKYIALTEEANSFIIEEERDFDEDRFETAQIIEEKCVAFSWKNLTDKKKEFLIGFIKKVFLEKIEGQFEYAEHFLLCMYLNPYTPASLIEKYLLDIDSEVIHQAVAFKSR
jgi:hypothetical protein